MVWQDIVISASVILMSYALIPQVFHGFKTKKTTITVQTALMTTIAVFVMAAAFFSIGLIFSGTMDVIIGTLWLLLLAQSLMYK